MKSIHAGLARFREILSPHVSGADSCQRDAWGLLIGHKPDASSVVVDLGSGDGSSIRFNELSGDDRVPLWIGLDIERANTNPLIEPVVYDGVHVPFRTASCDIVYSRQVLEHVRQPDAVVREILRILKPGGIFIGSVSHTEPYHAGSIFNWTPFGVVRVFGDAGFTDIVVYPGIDSISLILRRFVPGGGYLFRHESPVNLLISVYGKISGSTHTEINVMKLALCGHVCFSARKPGGSPHRSPDEDHGPAGGDR